MRNKGISLLIAALVIFSCGTAFGQFGALGFKAGYNFATLGGSGVEDAETLQRLAIGLSLEFNFLGIVGIEGDVLYSMQGASFPNDSETKLSYIMIPILLKQRFFPVGIRPYILGGPAFSFLLSAEADGEDIKDELRSQEVYAVIGAGLELAAFGKGIYVEGRYCYGLTDILKDDIQTMKNRVAQLFIGIFL